MGSISKAGFSSENNAESPEESGWTTHFDYFFNNQKPSPMSSDVNSSSSLVSDATSLNLAAKKVTYSDDQTREEFSVNKNVSCRRSNFRKRKKAQAVDLIVDDDVLQDTASSPLINSFKVI
ncbi:uncharacterized protein LOC114762390 [Neltuma alba]|uniref:uncharacterized protein LOC114762390 n=1 Tax=Neltuma alba TaxID=207710 RepID=UPI0010A3D9A2|nr:uncharacterized protein LOC114762390 [Prosopis alba]